MKSTVVVGALARIEPSRRTEVICALVSHEGVSTFELEHDAKLGVLVEAESLDAAHALITRSVADAPGVLGVWPVSLELDPDVATLPVVSPERIAADEE